MRWIDFSSKKPTDPIPDWTVWTQKKWDRWLAESKKLHGELAKLHKDNKIDERNKFIDDHSKHWGKLKPWLLALSYGKCWFTEGRDICSHFEVEHFRPKKEATQDEVATRDAYWWLAFDYTNYCVSGNVSNRKKGTQFPLRINTPISTYETRCEHLEEPYLLNPTNPTDPNLLAFDEEGNAIPIPGCDEWSQKRVGKSIEILKLNEHDILPKARREIWQKISRLINSLSKHFNESIHHVGNPQALLLIKENIKDKKNQILEMIQPCSPLSMAAIWCIKFRNDPLLLKLLKL
jgi:hypothetical protein